MNNHNDLNKETNYFDNTSDKPGKGNIMTIIFVVWFIMSLFLIIYFAQERNGTYIAMLFGQYFLVFGIIFLTKTCKEKNKSILDLLIPLLFIIIGLCCIVIPYLMANPHILIKKEITIDYEKLIIGLFFTLSMITGLGMICIYFYKKKEFNSNDLIKVSGEVINLKKKYDNGKELYAPDIKYNFEGKNKIYESIVYTRNDYPKINSIVELRINPKTKEVFYKKPNLIILLLMGIIFVVMTTLSIYLVFFM